MYSELILLLALKEHDLPEHFLAHWARFSIIASAIVFRRKYLFKDGFFCASGFNRDELLLDWCICWQKFFSLLFSLISDVVGGVDLAMGLC